MRVIRQYSVPVVSLLMVSSADHITGRTGLGSVPCTVMLVPDNGADPWTFSVPAAEADSANFPGIYIAALPPWMTSWTGEIVMHAEGDGCDPTDRLLIVEKATLSDVADVGRRASTVVTFAGINDGSDAACTVTIGAVAISFTWLAGADAAGGASAFKSALDAISWPDGPYYGSRVPGADTVAVYCSSDTVNPSLAAAGTPAGCAIMFSTGSAMSGGTPPLRSSVAAIPDDVWDTPAAAHTTVGTFGYYLRRIFGWMFWRKEITAGQITTYDSDSATILGTQTITGDGITASSVSKEA